MKIVYYSRLFYPVGGGSVNIVDQLSKEWVREGHEVVVITPTLEETEDSYPYEVVRTQKLLRVYKEFRSADSLFFNETSLRGMPIALLSGKKYKVSHQANFSYHRNFLNRFLRCRGKQIACSQFIADQRPEEGINVIGNPYDNHIFKAEPKAFSDRTTDITFVGRLSEDKGADIFIDALVLLDREVSVKIIGDGPSRVELEKVVNEKKINVEFLGWKSISEIADVLNNSKIQVIPSRFKEPFGIVALEGLAMGCRLVVMGHGGLPESTGGYASLMKELTAEDCAQGLDEAFDLGDYSAEESLGIKEHLVRHESGKVARRYLEL